MQRLHRIHSRAEHREPAGEIIHLERAAQELFKPATGDVHVAWERER
jgi:hypothetical protein